MVAIGSLTLPATLLAADFDAPAAFNVTQTVTNPEPGAFTFTMGDGPVNSWLNDSYEAFTFQRKWYAQADLDDEIALSMTQSSGYNVYQEGFYDGAEVRVYRIIDGEFVQVREDTVASGGHHASGWSRVGSSDEVVTATTFTNNFAGYNRPNVPYWYTVTAVDDQGNESGYATAVSITPTSTSGQSEPSNTTAAFSAPSSPSETNPPPTPTNVQASLDSEGRVVLTWNAVSDSGLAGYRVYRSDYNPANHSGAGLVLAGTASTEQEKIKQGDLVFLTKQHYNWDRDALLTNRVWGAGQYSPPNTLHYYSNENAGQSWELVPHPGTVPSALEAEGGQRCVEIDLNNTNQFKLWSWNYSGLDQSYYKALTPGTTYVVEFWCREDNMTTPEITFDLKGGYSDTDVPPTTFTVDGQWTRYTTTFTVPFVWEEANGAVGEMGLSMNGPGTVYIDNYRVYEQGTDFLDFPQIEYNVLSNSGMSFARTHSTIKSGDGYTMESLTNYRGAVDYRGRNSNSPHTMDSLLSFMDTANIDPWLQVEFYHTEEEFLGLVEFLAAPYDPNNDTPSSKPWAYKRYSQGREDPWTDAFSEILFELSNETWNPLFDPWTFNFQSMTDTATSQTYNSGELYGLWQEYILDVMRSSPYWTQAIEDKFSFVLGGWAAQPSITGYGAEAAFESPSSDYLTIANYNGGWEAGETSTEVTDENFFKVLNIVNRTLGEKARTSMSTIAALEDAGVSDLSFGTYEGGPGYFLPNSEQDDAEGINKENESQVMKSQVGGVSTLDTFLYSAMVGFDTQNYFTWSRNRYFWVSHAPLTSGGQAYPAWKTLELYNNEGLGDFLRVNQESVPTWDFDGDPDKPLVSVYVTRDADRYNVFVLSNKLDDYPVESDDGHTPVTVSLPFTSPDSITLYKMDSGDPQNHNLDSDVVQIDSQSISTSAFSQDFVVDDSTGADANGLPPGTVYLYVFEGVNEETLPSNPVPEIVRAPGQEGSVDAGPVEFLVNFDREVTDFDDPDTDVLLLGSADPGNATITPEPGSFGTSYRVTVSGMTASGDIQIDIPADAAQSADTSAGNVSASGSSSSVTLSITEEVPDAPSNLRFSENANGDLVLYWDYSTALAKQADTYTVRYGTTSGSLNQTASGLTQPSFVLTSYTPGTPLYFTVEATNGAGTSAASEEAQAFSYYDDFDSYSTGSAPTGWSVSGNTVTVETPPSGLSSPTSTNLLKNVGWGTGMITYDAGSNLEFYTVEAQFARGGTNGYDSSGIAGHFDSTSSYFRIHISSSDVNFHSLDGSQYNWKQSRALVEDQGESDYVQDYGEFWTVSMSIQPGTNAGTSKIAITVKDQNGNDMIDHSSSGTSAGSAWVLDNVPAPQNGNSGTFGFYGNVVNGGTQIESGVFYDWIRVTPESSLNEAPRVTSELAVPATVSSHETTLELTAEDANGDDLTYTFETLVKPSGSSVMFDNGATANAASRASVAKDVTVDTDGIYKFRVSVSDGTDSVNSRTRSVYFENASGPTITSQPQGQTVEEGSNLTIVVAASGSNLTYQWQSSAVSAGSWSDIGGATSDSLSLTNVVPSDEKDYRVVVTDDQSNSVTSNVVTVYVDLVPSITTSSLPDGTVGQAYSQGLNAHSGTGSLTWSLASGSLPSGLSLSSGGTISGTPSAAGSESFSVSVTDSNNDSDSQALSLTVNSASQGSGTVFAEDDFDTSATTLLGVSTGSGWSSNWKVQNNDTSTPGFEIRTASPFSSGSGGGYAVGGTSYLTAGRDIDLSNAPSALIDGNGDIGADGETVWISALVRADSTSINGEFISIVNGCYPCDWSKMASTWVQNGDWTLRAKDSSGNDVYDSTGISVSASTELLVVLEVEFGSSQDTIRLYIDPADTSSPDAEITTSGSLAFTTISFRPAIVTNAGSMDDLKVGTSFEAVTGISGVSLTNTLNRDYWTGISGSDLSALTNDTDYPSNPDGSDELTGGFDAVGWTGSSNVGSAPNWADSYGERIYGYLVPEETGDYVFWISGDDDCNLYLSTDETPGNASLIASVDGWTNYQTWSKYTAQKSSTISLTAGEVYYIEALHKEGGGGDSCSVGWAKPGESTSAPSEVVPASVLSSWSAGDPGN